MTQTVRYLALGAALAIGAASLNAEDPARADAGQVVMTVLPSRGRELAVSGLTRTTATAGRLVGWTRTIESLYRGRYVPAIGRFSTPPRVDDLAGLTLDDQEVKDLRGCRPGDCEIRLATHEIDLIRHAAAAGDRSNHAVQRAFEQVLLARAEHYLRAGLGPAPAYRDRERPEFPQAEFTALAAGMEAERLDARALAYFGTYPAGSGSVESFLYWSKESLGGGKPIVSITHVAFFRDAAPLPHVTIAARQVYASHYLTASLSLTSITERADSTFHSLVYERRVRSDAFDGAFGWLVRSIVERRIRSDGPAVLDRLRRTLEDGEPPAPDTTS